jgi:uncharacterized protein YndB with AHSA1/START domain
MKGLVIAGALVVGVPLLMMLVGATLPRAHVASRTARFAQAPAALWPVLTDPEGMPTWRTDVKTVERLPDRDGRLVWRESGGERPLTFEVVEARAPFHLVTRIADKDLPFGGSWTYELRPEGAGTLVTITENGEVHNVLFRFMARFVFGYTGTMDAYLTALGKRFGETVVPTGR